MVMAMAAAPAGISTARSSAVPSDPASRTSGIIPITGVKAPSSIDTGDYRWRGAAAIGAKVHGGPFFLKPSADADADSVDDVVTAVLGSDYDESRYGARHRRSSHSKKNK